MSTSKRRDGTYCWLRFVLVSKKSKGCLMHEHPCLGIDAVVIWSRCSVRRKDAFSACQGSFSWFGRERGDEMKVASETNLLHLSLLEDWRREKEMPCCGSLIFLSFFDAVSLFLTQPRCRSKRKDERSRD